MMHLNNPLLAAAETSFTPAQSEVSLSGTTDGSLLPVTLEPALMQEYEGVFFPRRGRRGTRTTKSGFEITAELAHYHKVIDHMAMLSLYVNALFASIRQLAFNSVRMPTDTALNVLESDFRHFLSMGASKDALPARKKQYYESIPGSHIITKAKGGYDLVFSGLPGAKVASGGTCLNVPIAALPYPIYKTEYSYTSMAGDNDAHLKTPVYTLAAALASTLHKSLTGTTPSVGVAHTRRVYSLPLDFDLQSVISALDTLIGGLKPGSKPFSGVQSPLPEVDAVRGLKKYLSYILVVEPVRQVLDRVIASQTKAPLTTDTSSELVADYSLFSSTIGLSLRVHIPEAIANYITQTSPGQQLALVPLNTWAGIWTKVVFSPPGVKNKGGKLYSNQAPRYVLSSSKSFELSESRKKLGFYAEPGRNNEDGIFVSNDGRLHWCPAAKDVAPDNAKAYESLMESALQLSYDAGSPLQLNRVGVTDSVFALGSPQYADKIRELKSSIAKHAGSLQTFNWDYNVILTSAVSDPEKLIAYNLAGAVKPDALALSEYLRMPFHKAMITQFNRSTPESEPETFGSGGSTTLMLTASPFVSFFKLYHYLLLEGKVPALQDLVSAAAAELKLTALDQDPYNTKLYNSVLTNDLKVIESFSSTEKIEVALGSLMRMALRDSDGHPGSNLARVAQQNGVADVTEDPHYLSPAFFNLSEFKNVYLYLGGRTFLNALRAVIAVPRKDLMVPNPANAIGLPSFSDLVREVLPMVYLLGKYVTNSEQILAEAEELAESNRIDTGITADDTHLPGSRKGFQLFPHQLRAHQFLRKAPRFAVLDISPGGGKTILLLSDAGALIHAGKLKTPPCLLAPNSLVKVWVEDLHKVTEGRWNAIPITTATFRTWGDERLTKLIKTAPVNTMVVLSTGVLTLDKQPIVIGNHVEQVSAVMEFARKFGFEYVALDESHRGKNVHTGVHKAVKQLTTASCVKYVRLATGTLIKDRLTDVVGQSALLSAQIFRTAAEYEDENSERIGDTKVVTWKKDTPRKAREQLSRYAAVVTAKRKDWAFMLPRPIETFIPVRLEKSDAEGGAVHQLMYEAILKETLDEIKKDPEIMKLLGGSGAEEEDDDADSTEVAKAILTGTYDDGDLDEASLVELESKLEPYLARLEQLLTDPLGDEFGEVYFKGIDKNFVSNKTLKVIERIRKNFELNPWIKAKQYFITDLVDYDGKRYVLKGKPGEKLTLDSYAEEYTSIQTPDTDPRWKLEPAGKVLVFCRYTRSVNAIFRALPADLQKIAAKFHGKIADKWDNLEKFKRTPVSPDSGVQILIANEQSISEGHNLQMCSRQIRVESPWSPGELDQSTARIFRPDPTGKFSRENIYLDWVLCNGCLTGDALIPTSKGIFKIEDLVANGTKTAADYKVVGRLKNEKGLFALPTGKKPVYEVTLDNGRHITATSNHKFYGYCDGKFGWFAVADLTASHYLCLNTRSITTKFKLPLRIPVELATYSPRASAAEYDKLIKMLGDRKVFTTKDITEHTSYTYWAAISIVGKLARKGVIRQLSESTRNGSKHTSYEVVDVSGQTLCSYPVTLPEVMTPELAYCLGLFVAEGHAFTSLNIEMYNEEPVAKFTANINKLFNLDITYTVEALDPNRSKCTGNAVYEDFSYKVRVPGPVHKIFAYLGIYVPEVRKARGLENCSHAAQKVVPWSILEANTECQRAFLAGHWEGDGARMASGCMAFVSFSKNILQGIAAIISSLGIDYDLNPFQVSLRTNDSIDLFAQLAKYVVGPKTITHTKHRGRLTLGIPSKHTFDFVQSRFLEARTDRSKKGLGGYDSYLYETDTGDTVYLNRKEWYALGRGQGGATGRLPTFLYDSYSSGSYSELLGALKKISVSHYRHLRGQLEAKQDICGIRSIRYKGKRQTYDLSISTGSDGKDPSFVANGFVSHNSLEVAKMGRLISKMIIKSQFDEASNPLYSSIHDLQLPLIRMSMSMIASVPTLSDITEYIDAYRQLVHVQSAEFEEMRQTRATSMIDIPETPMMEGSAILEQVPYLPELDVPDRHDFGLVRLTEYLQDSENPEVRAILSDKPKLMGQYVHTEFGNGVISGVRLSKSSKDSDVSVDTRKISRIEVTLASGDTYGAAPSMIHMALNVSEANVKDFSPRTKLLTARDKRHADKVEKALALQEKRAAARSSRSSLAARSPDAATAPRVARPKPEVNRNLELFPVVYNGFLAIEASPEDSEMKLSTYGFKTFGNYAYAVVKDYVSFNALLDWLDKKFVVSRQTTQRLEALQETFQAGRGRKFDVQLAPLSEFRNFYVLRHKLSGKDKATGKPELKLYPVIINDTLMVVADIATNPSIKRQLDKLIPGTRNLKFQEASGLHIKFFSSKSELVQTVKGMRADGVNVTNYEEFKTEYRDLKLVKR